MRSVMLAAALLLAGPAAAGEYQLPEETATLAPGPHLDLVMQNCLTCHSADYISTQPRRLANPRGFWQAEVAKMKQAYGAPLAADDMPKIVDYLVQTYGP